MKQLRIFCTSDTHTKQAVIQRRNWLPEVDACDVLVYAGDATWQGRAAELVLFRDWLLDMQEIFPHVVVIAGNHDCSFQDAPDMAKAYIPEGVHYLEDSGVEIEGFKFWGSPWQPWFHDWAFNYDRGGPNRWKAIPDGTDVLVTHGPPLNIGDMTLRGEAVGCYDLRNEIFNRVKPKLHVFGHIHEGYGEYEEAGIKFVNASLCNLQYEPVNKPITVTITKE